MSVRQYIGARYVPLFMGDWDNTVTYEPLSIVQYQGNSYTSRQFVPVGIPITNDAYWASTGNYNAQIEQYRGEVVDLANRVDALETFVDTETGDLKISMINTKYTLTLVQAEDVNIVFECGYADDSNAIVNFFRNKNVTHIDALIITHYHRDHFSGIDTVANYCDENTIIYEQMEVDNDSALYTDYYSNRQEVIAVLNSHSLRLPVVPIEGSTAQYGNITLTFFNTDVAYRSDYEDAWGNTNNALNLTDVPNTVTRIPTLNNYSLVTRLQYGSSTYLDTGDIEGAAQINLVGKMQPCSIAKLPHHLVNRMGYLRFFETIKPKAWIVSHNGQGTNLSETDIDSGKLQYYYIYRYLMFNCDDTPLITNINSEVNVNLIDGELINYTGRVYRYTDFSTMQLGIPSILPPNYYSENPFVLYTLTLDDMWGVRVATGVYPKFVFRANYTWEIGEILLMQQIKSLFPGADNYSVMQTIYIDFFDNPRIKYHSYNYAYNTVELMSGFNYSNFLNGEIAYKKYSDGNAPRSITGSWADGETIASTDYNLIKQSKQLVAKLDNNTLVPLFRLNSDFSAAYSGMCMNDTGTAIYFVHLASNGAVSCSKRNIIATDSVASMTIIEIKVIA